MRNYTSGFVAKNRNRWIAIVNWQDEVGKQRRVTKSTGVPCRPDRIDPETGEKIVDNRGKQMAETFLRSWRDELVAQEAAQGSRQTRETAFSEYARLYIEQKEKSGSVRTVTVKGYLSHLRHIEGTALGNCPIGELGPKVVEGWLNGLIEDGLSSTTASHIFVFTKQVCSYARRMGDIASNPFDLVEAPRRSKPPVNSLTAESMRELLVLLDGFGSEPFAVAVKIALLTGMRQAEICALRFCDVDFSARIIHVRRSLGRFSGSYKPTTPKTESSMRDIPFGEGLLSALEARKALVQKARDEMDLPWSEDLYIVGSPYEIKFYNPQVLGHDWRSFIRTTGIKGTTGAPPRFHDLRHSFATASISASIDVKSVSSILGHASAAMTLDVYSAALMGSKRSGMEVVDGLLSGNHAAEGQQASGALSRPSKG